MRMMTSAGNHEQLIVHLGVESVALFNEWRGRVEILCFGAWDVLNKDRQFFDRSFTIASCIAAQEPHRTVHRVDHNPTLDDCFDRSKLINIRSPLSP